MNDMSDDIDGLDEFKSAQERARALRERRGRQKGAVRKSRIV